MPMRRRKAHAVEITAASLLIEKTITVITMTIERYDGENVRPIDATLSKNKYKNNTTTHLVRVDPTSVRTIL